MKMKWSQQDMANAVRAVREDKVPLQRAAKQFKVPRNTLRYRIDNEIPIENLKYVQRGPVTALCRADEDSLANFIVYLEKHGFMLHKKVINDFAWSMAKKEGTHIKFRKGAGPGKQWWSRFRQRHPEVKLWKPRRSLPETQAKVTMKTKVNRHFKTLNKILDENFIKNSKRRIFNCGESGVEVDLVSRTGSRDTRQDTGNTETKEHISVQLCVTASGEALPPMIIFKGQRAPKGKCIQGGPVGTLYASSKTGFLNSDLYLLWFKKIFLKYVTDSPVVLIQEGTSCHLTPEIVECAQENNVALYCIPSGTSSALQPLEVSVMEPLRNQLKNVVTRLHQNPDSVDSVITRNNFASIFREPFENAMTKHIIRRGFRKTGICPWNPHRIAIMETKPKQDLPEIETIEEVTMVQEDASLEKQDQQIFPVHLIEVPEPIRGPDDEIIEMVVTADNANSEVLVIDQAIDMVVCTSAEAEAEEIVEHSISSDDLDDFLADDEDLSESDLESLHEGNELTLVVDG